MCRKLGALLFLPMALWAQEKFSEDLPPGLWRQLEAERERLKQENLEVQIVEAKTREGLIKNVPPERIVQVVRQEVNLRLRSARMLQEAGHPKKAELIQAMVIALRRGAREEDLAKALRMKDQSEADLLKRIDLLGHLAQIGIQGERAQMELVRINADMQDFGQKSQIMREIRKQKEQSILEPTRPEIAEPRDGITATGSPRQEKQLSEIYFH
ncbi:MAG: hypothetical protein NZM25_10865 [Leptospiraceae bacterium]|nr:hypothetical protein [Leptospiraceae bacterium]MDW8305930.1 hypothetical protein [Leptospiraceae bacterium]